MVKTPSAQALSGVICRKRRLKEKHEICLISMCILNKPYAPLFALTSADLLGPYKNL